MVHRDLAEQVGGRCFGAVGLPVGRHQPEGLQRVGSLQRFLGLFLGREERVLAVGRELNQLDPGLGLGREVFVDENR